MHADTGQPAQAAGVRRWALPIFLLAGLLIGPAIYLQGTIGDENIWAGIGLGWTAMWGVPWSLPFVFGAVPIESGNLIVTLLTVCGLLNVFILTLAVRKRSGRASTPQ